MLNEFLAQLAEQAKSATLKINFRVGYLLIKAGGLTQFLQPSKVYHAPTSEGSEASTKVSVLTPSIA